MWPLGGFFLDFQLSSLKFGFYLLVMHFFLSNPVVGTLGQLILTLSSIHRLCKNKPPNAHKNDSYNVYLAFLLLPELRRRDDSCQTCDPLLQHLISRTLAIHLVGTALSERLFAFQLLSGKAKTRVSTRARGEGVEESG